MQSASQKIAVAVKDRRLINSPSLGPTAFWRTYLAAASWGALYFYAFREGRIAVPMLFVGVLMIALTAAQDATRGIERKIDAIVRCLEEKDVV
jgi:hypothetical protein